MNVENTHKVSSRQWRKWSERGQTLFNDVYEDVRRVGQLCFLHPDTIGRRISDTEFDAMAWNAAWTAAYLLDNPGDMTARVDTVECHEIDQHLAVRACGMVS